MSDVKRVIGRIGRLARMVANDDILVGLLVIWLSLLLSAGVALAMKVAENQGDLKDEVTAGRLRTQLNGEILTFIQECNIPEDRLHKHARGTSRYDHNHKCYDDAVKATDLAVRKAAVQVDCRVRRGAAGLPPPPDDQDCSWDFAVGR